MKAEKEKSKEKAKSAGKEKKRWKEKKERRRSFSRSLFMGLFARLSDAVYNALQSGLFGRIFNAYDAEDAVFESGFVNSYFLGNPTAKKSFRKVREKLSEGFETSFFLGAGRRFVRAVLTLPMRSYGNFWMSFGIYTILVYIISLLVPSTILSGNIDYMIAGAVMCIAAIPLIFSDKNLANEAGSGYFSRLVFADAFGFRDENFEVTAAASHKKSNLMIFGGMVCGILTFFVSPWSIVGAIFLVAGVVMVMSVPEIGVLMSLFLLPFFNLLGTPATMLGLTVCLTFFSYLIKLVQGKRIFRAGLLDITVILFGIVLLFGGIVSAGGTMSFRAAFLSLTLMMSYFLIVNLMRTAKWLKRCLVALVSSATIVSTLGILQYLFGTLNTSTLDRNYFFDIRGRVTVLFGNSNLLAFYLAMIFPLTLAFLLESRRLQEKLLLLFSCLVQVACIVFTWSRGAWIAVILSTLIFLLIYSRNTMKWLFLLVLGTPLLPIVLPDTVWHRFSSIGDLADSSTMYRVYTWRGTFRAIKEYFFSGVGYGPEVFEQIYPAFSYAGIEAAGHAHSLYLQLWFGLGFSGLLVFLAVIFFFTQQIVQYLHAPADNETRVFCACAFCATIAALIMGFFDYIWYSYLLFFLFWILVALASAYTRFGKCEIARKHIAQAADDSVASLDIAVQK